LLEFVKPEYSLEDYRRKILDKGYLDFDLKIEKSYREKGWGMWEAIREFCQNSLDALDEAGLESKVMMYRDGRGTVIQDYGSGIQIKHFIFRTFKKQPWERGMFGEGMKLATLACLREGFPVEFLAPGLEAYGVLVWDPMLEGMILHIPYKEGPGFGTRAGTKITILGYFGDMFIDRFTPNLPSPVVRVPAQLDKPKQRYLELYTHPTGRVYIRDIYLYDENSEFSYNLWDFTPAPDRHGPEDPTELQIDIARLWAQVTDESLLERFFRGVEEKRLEAEARFDYMEVKYRDMMKENQDIWRRAFSRVFGPNAVVDKTTGRLRARLEYHGYTTVYTPWVMESVMGEILTSDTEKALELIEMQQGERIPVPDERLTKQQLLHLDLLRWINARIGYPRAEGIRAAELPLDPATMHKTKGQTEPDMRLIWIDLSALDKFTEALSVYVHEMGHVRTPGAEHHEPRYINATTDVAAEITRLVTTSPLPPVWGDVVWH